MVAPKKGGFGRYIKKAFLNHWNLLAVGAGAVLGAIGVFAGGIDPLIVLPVVAAGEALYLGGLATHPKYQAYVDASDHKLEKARVKAATTDRIFKALDPRSRARFEELRRRCQNLQMLAEGVGSADMGEVGSMHYEGINKLLWVFLKLLYSKRSLEIFLQTTDEMTLRSNIDNVQKKIERLGPEPEDTDAEVKMRRTLDDTLKSANMRLTNWLKAQENHEYIQLELDRIDAKITSIAELAVNRQEPDFITSEVDGVAATMESTESAMAELQFLSGLDDHDLAPPSFVDESTDLEKA